MPEGMQEIPDPQRLFREGDPVRISDGPFTNFTGVVEAVHPDRYRLNVSVTMYSHQTPIEFSYLQVEKLCG